MGETNQGKVKGRHRNPQEVLHPLPVTLQQLGKVKLFNQVTRKKEQVYLFLSNGLLYMSVKPEREMVTVLDWFELCNETLTYADPAGYTWPRWHQRKSEFCLLYHSLQDKCSNWRDLTEQWLNQGGEFQPELVPHKDEDIRLLLTGTKSDWFKVGGSATNRERRTHWWLLYLTATANKNNLLPAGMKESAEELLSLPEDNKEQMLYKLNQFKEFTDLILLLITGVEPTKETLTFDLQLAWVTYWCSIYFNERNTIYDEVRLTGKVNC